MRLQPKLCESKDEYFFFLYNKLGCTDLKLAYARIDSLGVPHWTKHIPYGTLMSLESDAQVVGTGMTKAKFLDCCNQRTVLDIEILIDIDKGRGKWGIEQTAKFLVRRLRDRGIEHTVWFTGSKSYHISVLIPKLREWTEEQQRAAKEMFLRSLEVDTQKVSTGSMIALEECKHYKSGKVKSEVLWVWK
jgi:hypothetical protein